MQYRLFCLCLEMTIPPQFCFNEGTLRTGMKQEFATCILAQRSAELGRCVNSELELFLWDTLNGMELNLLIWSCCGCRCAHMQKHFVMLYLFSVVPRSLRRHGASYILFFVVDIFSVCKCSLKVWGSKQLLSWVAEQCFGHELVIHCKWFLHLFRIGFAVSVKVHDRYIDPHSTNQMLLSV